MAKDLKISQLPLVTELKRDEKIPVVLEGLNKIITPLQILEKIDPTNSVLYLDTQTEYDELVKLKVIKYPNVSYIKELDKCVYFKRPFYPYPRQFTIELTLEYIDDMKYYEYPGCLLLCYGSSPGLVEELTVNGVDMKDKVVTYRGADTLYTPETPEKCKAGDTYDIKIKTSLPFNFHGPSGFLYTILGIGKYYDHDIEVYELLPAYLKVKHICVDDYMFENFGGEISSLWPFLININKPEVCFDLTKPVLKSIESLDKHFTIMLVFEALQGANQITPDTQYVFNILKGKSEIYGNPSDKIIFNPVTNEPDIDKSIFSFYSFINLINENVKTMLSIKLNIIKIVEK